jgi:hypothetical protein
MRKFMSKRNRRVLNFDEFISEIKRANIVGVSSACRFPRSADPMAFSIQYFVRYCVKGCGPTQIFDELVGTVIIRTPGVEMQGHADGYHRLITLQRTEDIKHRLPAANVTSTTQGAALKPLPSTAT